MREAIGGTWITQLIIVFMFIFVAFLALSLNYSKAFRVKNEVLSFVEKNEGITLNTVKKVNNYLKYSGYNSMGKCAKGMYGVANLNATTYTLVNDSNKNNKFYYCIGKIDSKSINFQNRAYYKAKLFFKFNLPVVGNIFNFEIDGQTKDVLYPADGSCEDRSTMVKCLN